MLNRELQATCLESATVFFRGCGDNNVRLSRYKALQEHEPHTYYVGLPAQLLEEHSNLIDQLLGFAFDTLDMRSVVVHVRESE